MIIKNIQHFSEMGALRERYGKERSNKYARPEDIGSDRIAISWPLYRLRGTTLIIAEGTYCAFDKDSNSFVPGFSVSLLYNADAEPELNKPLYWESSSADEMFHHFAIMQAELGVDTKKYLSKGVA